MSLKIFMNIRKGLLSAGESRNLFLKISPRQAAVLASRPGWPGCIFLSSNYLTSTDNTVLAKLLSPYEVPSAKPKL